MLRLRDIMTRRVVTFEPQMALREALEILTSRHRGRLVGLVSAMDIAKAVADRKLTDTTYMFDKA